VRNPRSRRVPEFARALVLGAALAGAALLGPTPRAAAEGDVPLDRFFKGAVIGLDGTKIRLRYDFSTTDQIDDWPQGQPFNVMPDPTTSTVLSEGRMLVRGMIGIRHIGEWEGDLVLTARIIPDGTKDIGSFLSSPEQLDDYVSYSIAETYWHGWDGKAGGETGMMKFGKQYATSTKGGYTGFRYLDFRRPTVDPTAGKPVAWTFGRRGDKLLLTMDDLKLDSVEPGNRLKVLQAGFYAMKSSMAVDDIVIEGTLAPKYVATKHLSLRTERPIVPDAAAGLDPAVTALIEGFRAGKESVSKLVAVVADASRTDADRGAAVAAIKAGPRRSLPAVTDLLFSTDLKSRTYGIEIVKAMTGKNYGYDPRGGEKARGNAVKKLNDDMAAHPELLQGSAG
jgi:hypothetical protein